MTSNFDHIEHAKMIYQAQPNAFTAAAYQVVLQLDRLKEETEYANAKAKKAMKAAQELQKKLSWHPVKGDPPDHTVLVSYEQGGQTWVGIGYYEYGGWNGGEYVGWVCDDQQGLTPTHWMELPEGPK